MNEEQQLRNIAIGEYALSNLENGNDNVCIGKNAGAELVNANNQIRIGNFSMEEIKLNKFDDCVIIADGRVIIKKDIFILLELPDLLKEYNIELIK